ncbi:MAG: DUF1990 family protein [Blastocatellia bacterium]
MTHSFTFARPAPPLLADIAARQSVTVFSHDGVEGSREQRVPPGYDSDHHRVCLGRGAQTFAAACAALRAWRMFPPGWTEIHPPGAPLTAGQPVVMLAHCLGLWWINNCRVVYALDDLSRTPEGDVRRYGFAYGTLPAHVERGEERFLIEWNQADDSVWYDLWSFSQPARWFTRLGYPLARRLQRRFARDSMTAMQNAVKEAL